jgi:hypothetical protein
MGNVLAPIVQHRFHEVSEQVPEMDHLLGVHAK